MLSYLVIPSILAISIKVALFLLMKEQILNSNRYILLMFFSFLGLNVFELTLFTLVDKAGTAIGVMTLYYAFAVSSSVSMLAVALDTVCNNISRNRQRLLVSVACFGLIILFIPDFVITGTRSIGYSVTAIPGDYYWLVRGIILILLISTLTILVKASFIGEDWLTQKKAFVLAICFTPLIFSVVAVFLLMSKGININATVIGSFSITFLLVGVIFVENKYRLYGFIGTVPVSKYTFSSYRLANAFLDPNVSLEEAKNIMDNEKFKAVIEITKGNQTKAAELLGCSRSTVSRRVKSMREKGDIDS